MLFARLFVNDDWLNKIVRDLEGDGSSLIELLSQCLHTGSEKSHD